MVAGSILEIFLTMKTLLISREIFPDSVMFDPLLESFAKLWQVRTCQKKGRRTRQWIYIGTVADRQHKVFRSTMLAAHWCVENTEMTYRDCGNPRIKLRRHRFFWPAVRVGMLTGQVEWVRGRGWVTVNSGA